MNQKYLGSIWLLAAILLLFSISLNAATYRTVSDGNWTESSTWLDGNVPPDPIQFDSVFVYHDIFYDAPYDLVMETSVFQMIGANMTFPAGADRFFYINESTFRMYGGSLVMPIYDNGQPTTLGDITMNESDVIICAANMEIAENWFVNECQAQIITCGIQMGLHWEISLETNLDLTGSCIEVGLHEGGGFTNNESTINFAGTNFLIRGGLGDFFNYEGYMIGTVANLLVPGDIINDATPPSQGSWDLTIENYCVGGVVDNVDPVYLPATEDCDIFEGADCAIAEIPPLELSCGVISSATCGNADGEIEVLVSGGLQTCGTVGGDYDYQWSNGGTTSTLTNLEPGVYTVTVTDLAGDTSSCTIEVEETGCPGGIMGAVMDENYVGIGGVALYLLNVDGDTVAQVVTNESPEDLDGDGLPEDVGYYYFGNIMPGFYNIVEAQPYGYADMMEMDGGDDGDHEDNGITNNIPATVASSEQDMGNLFIETYLLPINLVKFEAERVGKDVRVEWIATGLEGERFELQHTLDGKHYETIFTTVVQVSDELITYSTRHRRPQSGTNYYRLKMHDNDGHIHYSPLRLVQFELSTIDVRLYPNPVKDRLFIELNEEFSGDRQISIYSLSGKLIRTILEHNMRVVDGGLQYIDTNDLTSGLYFIEIKSDAGSVVKRISVTH